MTHGTAKARNCRRDAINTVGWYPVETTEEIFAEFRTMVLMMHRTGHSSCSMAKILMVSWSMVRSELLGAGIKFRRGGRPPKYFVFFRNKRLPLMIACDQAGANYQTLMYRSRTNGTRPENEFYRFVEKA